MVFCAVGQDEEGQMPDITKCTGQGIDCPLKEDCWRYTAPSDEWQSYFAEMPYDKEKRECKHFWAHNKLRYAQHKKLILRKKK